MVNTRSLDIDELVLEDLGKYYVNGKKPQNSNLGCFNNLQKRVMFEKILQKESKAVHASSFEVLKEFELIENEL